MSFNKEDAVKYIEELSVIQYSNMMDKLNLSMETLPAYFESVSFDNGFIKCGQYIKQDVLKKLKEYRKKHNKK